MIFLSGIYQIQVVLNMCPIGKILSYTELNSFLNILFCLKLIVAQKISGYCFLFVLLIDTSHVSQVVL